MAAKLKKTSVMFTEIARVVSEDERTTTVVSEAPYNHGVLIRVESKYRNRDGNYVIAEAVTFVPSPRDAKK